MLGTRWLKYDRDYLCVNKSQFVPVIFEPPCTYNRVISGTAIGHLACSLYPKIF
jgi:hypothetical protein